MFQIYMKLIKSLIKIKKNNSDRNLNTLLWRSNPPILSPSFKIEETQRYLELGKDMVLNLSRESN